MRQTEIIERHDHLAVILSKEELLLLKEYHTPLFKKSQEKLLNFENRYEDRKKTDFFYKKHEELTDKYWYHKTSLKAIDNIINL